MSDTTKINLYRLNRTLVFHPILWVQNVGT